jgi:hypothetical protein
LGNSTHTTFHALRLTPPTAFTKPLGEPNRGRANLPDLLAKPGLYRRGDKLLIYLERDGEGHVRAGVLSFHGILAFARYWSKRRDISSKACESLAKPHAFIATAEFFANLNDFLLHMS